MGLKDTLQKIHFSPLNCLCKIFHWSQRQFCPRGGHKMSHVQQLLALTSSSCLMGSNGSGGSCTFGIDNERWKICGKAWLKDLVAQHFRSPKWKKKTSPSVSWWISGHTTAQGWHFRDALLSLSTPLLPRCFLYKTKYKEISLKEKKIEIAWPKQQIAALNSPLQFCLAFPSSELARLSFSQVSSVCDQEDEKLYFLFLLFLAKNFSWDLQSWDHNF